MARAAALIAVSTAAYVRVVGVPGRPTVLQVGWVGGECPTAIRLHVTRDGDRLRISIAEGPEPCLHLVGIRRAVELIFRGPIEADSVDTTKI